MKITNALLAKVMLTSTLLAAFFLALGLGWYLVAHVGASPGDHIFSGEPSYLRHPLEMLRRSVDWSAEGHRRALTMLGVLLLLLGPLVRVALVAIGYALEKNVLYTIVGALVFAVLALSLFILPG